MEKNRKILYKNLNKNKENLKNVKKMLKMQK